MTTVRAAVPADLEPLWALVGRAVAHMNALGNPQWGEDYPTRALYEGDLAAGDLWVAVDGGRVLGCACINGSESPEYAAVPWTYTGPVLSIHRLAVDPACQRQGVATALIAHAEDLARARGVKALHVDTYAKNDRMQNLLRKRGYVRRGDISLHGRPLRYPCFEKRLTE